MPLPPRVCATRSLVVLGISAFSPYVRVTSRYSSSTLDISLLERVRDRRTVELDALMQTRHLPHRTSAGRVCEEQATHA